MQFSLVKLDFMLLPVGWNTLYQRSLQRICYQCNFDIFVTENIYVKKRVRVFSGTRKSVDLRKILLDSAANTILYTFSCSCEPIIQNQ